VLSRLSVQFGHFFVLLLSVPPCPVNCKSGGTCPRGLWSRRHFRGTVSYHVGSLLYADDITLISHSVEVMQRMLDVYAGSQPVWILCLIRANMLSCGLALGLNCLVLR